MLRSVKLDRLPENLVFPEKLADRISYDTDSRQLQFRGFMSKTDFDKLVCLHNDIDYQRALERLFQICTFESAPGPSRLKSAQVLIFAGATAAIVAVGAAAIMFVR